MMKKLKTVAPTEIGIAKAEKMLGIENMYDTEHGVDFSPSADVCFEGQSYYAP